ncbi:MAG TPA: SPASM domain-containing protein, partial [bacterium]|nr:SPASM domain-containing protein [bacterium]
AKVRLQKKANEYGLRLEDWLPSVEMLEKEAGLCRTENPAFPGKPEIFKTEQIGRKRVPLPEEPSPGECVKKLLCHAPWQRLYIDCGGEVRPDCLCVHEQIAGKVPENSLREIWNGKRLKEYRQRIVRENCRDFCKLDCLIGRVPEKNLKFV